MKARRYDKRVQIFNVTRTSDNFGGYTTGDPVLQTTRWAEVSMVSKIAASQLRTDYGLDQNRILRRFTFRSFDFNRNNSFLTYKGNDWDPLVVEESDEYGVDLDIIAVLQNG